MIDLHLPALKDRPGDIALLAARFLREYSATYGGTVVGIEPKAMKALEDYDWPGNVRQLRNVIEKMVVLASGPKLTEDDIPEEIKSAPAPIADVHAAQTSPMPSESLADAEKRQIMAALAAAGNNKSKAAEALGISRRTLHRKLKEWGEGQ